MSELAAKAIKAAFTPCSVLKIEATTWDFKRRDERPAATHENENVWDKSVKADRAERKIHKLEHTGKETAQNETVLKKMREGYNISGPRDNSSTPTYT